MIGRWVLNSADCATQCPLPGTWCFSGKLPRISPGLAAGYLAFKPGPFDIMPRDLLPPAIAEVRAVYAELAKRPLARSCQALTECCQFHLTGLTPHLTKGEALVAAKGVRAAGRKALPESDDGACPLLKRATGRCLIYADRPFGCRTHFCAAAGGPYPRPPVLDLIRRLEAVDEQLGGAGPRKIAAAVAEALAELR